jgi:hypothetical protein
MENPVVFELFLATDKKLPVAERETVFTRPILEIKSGTCGHHGGALGLVPMKAIDPDLRPIPRRDGQGDGFLVDVQSDIMNDFFAWAFAFY